MSVSSIEENAFQMVRYMVEVGRKVYSWGDVRQELGITPTDFEAAYNYLYGNDCCHAAGQLGDDATILIDKGGYSFYGKFKEQRINFPREAEKLLKYLVEAQKPGFPFNNGDAVMKAFGWDKDLFMQAAQALGDEGLVRGQAADNNPYWLISVTSEGRNIVRSNFRRSGMNSGVHTGDITTHIHGNNNVLSIGSILTSASQSIQISSAINDSDKAAIGDLLDRLNNDLQEVPEDRADDAEAVAETAKSLVESASKEKPNKRLLAINIEGLKKAAENIAAITPRVLTTALAIISFVEKLPK